MNVKNLCFYTLLSVALTSSLSSCLGDEEPKRETTEVKRGERPTEKQLHDLVGIAAKQVADKKSYAISPNTRHEVTFNYDEKAIHYDEAKDKVSVSLTIRWKARKALISDTKYDFEMRGELIIDLSYRPDSYPAVFMPSYANDVTKAVATDGAATSTLSFDLKKK